jgi:hypothetical protein
MGQVSTGMYLSNSVAQCQDCAWTTDLRTTCQGARYRYCPPGPSAFQYSVQGLLIRGPRVGNPSVTTLSSPGFGLSFLVDNL